MPNESVPAAVRASLESERDHLRGQLDELATSGDASMSFDENFADSGQVAAEQGEAAALSGSLKEQLDDVEGALAKLDGGTYGTCETCGEAIAGPRLEAMPATRFCISHA